MTDTQVIEPHPQWGWPFEGGAMPRIHKGFTKGFWANFKAQLTPTLSSLVKQRITTVRESLDMRNFTVHGTLPEALIHITDEMAGVTVTSDGKSVTKLSGSAEALGLWRDQGVFYHDNDGDIYCNITSIRDTKVTSIDSEAVDDGATVGRRTVVKKGNTIGVSEDLDCTYMVKQVEMQLPAIHEGSKDDFESCAGDA
jgi:hypothetical protein